MEKIIAPIPGTITTIDIKAGQPVKAGQTVLILEALKMQNEIFCNTVGTVKEIFVKEGEKVSANQALVVIE